MQEFLKSKEWLELNVGFALDEGLANPINEFTVFYGERMPWCNNDNFSHHSITFTQCHANAIDELIFESI